VWFTEVAPGGKKAIGRIDPQTGAIQEFPTSGARGPGAITVGPGGNLWFTDDNNWMPSNIADRIGRIDRTTGQIQEFDLPAGHRIFQSMTVGSDGNIWYLGYNGMGNYELGEFNPSTGSVKISALPGPWEPTDITTGPDGNLWITVSAMEGSTHLFGVSEFNPITGSFLQLFEPGAKSVAPPTGNSAASNGSISASGSNVSATAGINFLTAVATFTPQVPIASPGQAYQATIEWGDGTTSSLVLTVTQNGTYDVTAGHAYQTAGTFTIKVTIGNYNPANPLGDNPVTVFSTANVQALNYDPFAMTW
jgi:streptogramin lyase